MKYLLLQHKVNRNFIAINSKYNIMFKITITQLDSKNKERIIDVKLVKTRNEAEEFIKNCKALPKQYKPLNKAPDCFYELSHI